MLCHLKVSEGLIYKTRVLLQSGGRCLLTFRNPACSETLPRQSEDLWTDWALFIYDYILLQPSEDDTHTDKLTSSYQAHWTVENAGQTMI